MARSLLLVALLSSSALGLQIPLLKLPQDLPQIPWLSQPSDGSSATKPRSLVNTTTLQKTIHSKNLMKRAEDLYDIAKLGEDEFGHPTRVIGGKGESTDSDAQPLVNKYSNKCC